MPKLKSKKTENSFTKLSIVKERKLPNLMLNQKTVFENKEVFVFEYEDFRKFVLVFDGNKTTIRDETTKKAEEIVKYFNTFLKENLATLKTLLPFIGFSLYGNFYPNKEIEKQKIVFFDMFFNDNWICYDHFTELMKLSNFETPKLLYKGLYEEFIEGGFLHKLILTEKKKKLLVKTNIELEVDGIRPSATFTENSLISNKKKDILRKNLIKDVSKILNKFVNGSKISEWNFYLKKMGIENFKSNLGETLSVLVKKSIEELSIDIALLAYREKYETKKIEKTIKKELPKIIRKSLNL